MHTNSKSEKRYYPSIAPHNGVHNAVEDCKEELTWYTADVHTSAAFLEGREAGVDNMGLGVLADAAAQGLLLSLQHGRQMRVWQALHNDALHECAAIIVLDVPHPLQARNSTISDQTLIPKTGASSAAFVVQVALCSGSCYCCLDDAWWCLCLATLLWYSFVVIHPLYVTTVHTSGCSTTPTG